MRAPATGSRLAALMLAWLGGVAGLRRYLELPGQRSIWRQVEVAGIPEGMLVVD